MSGWPNLALGTFGAGCAAGGLILWLAPRGRASRLAACVAGGAGLAGLLAATGLDLVEDRLNRWGARDCGSCATGLGSFRS